MAEKINNIPKFKFKPLNDSYDDIFTDKKSHYQEDLTTMVELEVIFDGMQHGFTDIETGEFRKYGSKFKVNKIRAEELLQNTNNLVKVVD